MAAVTPAAVGVARGDRLSLTAFGGIGLCLVAICFVSLEKGSGSPRRMRGPFLAVLAGTGFGAFFVLIQVGDDGTLWPLVASKAISVLMVAVAAVVAGRGPAEVLRNRTTLGIALLAGSLDVLGNALYVLAARAGMLSIAGVLSSLYPASTVLLARLVYGERLRPIQRIGLLVAVAGVGLVTSN
jgi:drug/metabolite transporter (DMT)-like permease